MAFQLAIPGFDGGNGIGAAFALPSPYIAEPTLEYRSQAPDVLKFSDKTPGCDNNAFAAEGTICTLYTDASGALVPMLVGELFWVPRIGEAGMESLDYEIRGPWQMLEDNVMQQQWNFIASADGTTAAQDSAHLLLGVDISGASMDNGQVIAEVIAWAITLGLPLQLGVIDAACNAPVPVDDVHDLPMSECIKRMMRFTPDAVAWWDYTATADGQPCPKFNVTRRAACPAISLPFAPCERIEIKARTDLVRDHVVLRYEQEGKIDNLPVITYIIDAYPGGSTGRESGALVSTIRLAGGNASNERQPVLTQPIPPNVSTPDQSLAAGFLQSRWPWLAKFSTDRIQVSNWGTWVQKPDPGPDVTSGAPQGNPANHDYSVADYPNELLSGTIPDWVKLQSVICATVGCSGTVSYIYPDTDDAESNEAFAIFGPDAGEPGAVPGFTNAIPFSFFCHGTNATTTTYESLSSYDEPEPAPIGLAQVLYTAWSQLQYEGVYSVITQECAGQSLGIVLNLTGGRAEWAAMNALVQSISMTLETGRTEFKFGAAEHLTPQDLMEQLRAQRQRHVSSHIDQRKTGSPAGPSVDGGGATPIATGNPPPTPAYPFVNFAADYTSTANGLPLTWDAIIGWGGSSFAALDHGGPLEKFELSVGDDESGWPSSILDEMGALDNVLSLVSGDDDINNDRIWIGATDEDGNGGSVMISPGDPSIYLSTNLDPGDDETGDPFIRISLSDMLIAMQDDHGAYLRMDLSDDPTFVASLGGDDGYSATLSNDELEIDSADGYADLTPGDLYLFDQATGGSIDCDASATGGKAMYPQLLDLCDGDSTVSAYFLMTDPS